MNKFLVIIMLLVLVSGCATNGDSHSQESTSYSEHYHNRMESKQIVINVFTDAIIENDTLIPGEGTDWGVEKNTFIDNVYGNELLDPNSELFEEYRISTNKSGISTVEPPLEIKLSNIDEELFTNPNYVFNKDNFLYAINYRYIVEAKETEKLKSITSNLISELNATNFKLTMGDEIDIDAFNFEEDMLMLKWDTADGTQFIRVSGVNFKDRFILDIFISNQQLN